MRSLKFYKSLTKQRVQGIVATLSITILLLYSYTTSKTWTRLDPPGVIVHKSGGLGNQLFIFACMYSLARKLGIPLYLETPSSEIIDSQKVIFYNSDKRPYVLHKFPLVYNKTFEAWYTNNSLSVFTANDPDLLDQNEKPLPNDKLITLGDYCQSEVFFKDYETEIKEMFQLQMTPEELARPPFRRWIDVINAAGENSVAVHIRRGDYAELVRDAKYWFTPISYYRTAIQMMLEKLDSKSKNVSFFVFSDHLDQVKEDLLSGISLPENVVMHFVSCSGCTTGLEDFYLMTKCKHMINANSTFSWWAAYLIKNLGKIIIAPEFHPKILEMYDEEDRKFKEYELTLFYPKEWIVLDPFKGGNG